MPFSISVNLCPAESMLSEYHNDDGYTLLPKAVEGALRRGLGRLIGLGMLAAIAIAWLSLVSWSVTDPSLTHTTRDPAANLFGYPGAVVSDLMLQTFGVISAVLLLAPMFWGLELVGSGRVSGARWKSLSYAASVLMLAGALSLVPQFFAWPLNHGYGGIVGDGIAAVAGWGFAHAAAEYAEALGFIGLFGCGLFFIFGSIGVEASRVLEAASGAAATSGRAVRRSTGRGKAFADVVMRQEPVLRPRPEPQLHSAKAPQSGKRAQSRFEPRLTKGMLPERHWREPEKDETNDFRRLDEARGRQEAEEHSEVDRGHGSEVKADRQPARVEVRSGPEFLPAFDSEADDIDVRGDDFDSDTDFESMRIARRFAPENRVGNRNALREILRNASRGLISPEDRPPAKEEAKQPKAAAKPATATTEKTAAIDEDEPKKSEQSDEVGDVCAEPAAVADHPMPDVEPPVDGTPPNNEENKPAQPRATMRKPGGYNRPSLNLLRASSAARPGPELTEAVLRGTSRLMEDALQRFGVKGSVVEVSPGPVVTAYEIQLEKGTNPLRVAGLADDIGRSMNTGSLRVGVMPGPSCSSVVIELPNVHRHRAALRDLLSGESYRSFGGNLPVALGLSTAGQPVIADLGGLSNLLIAGRESSGKSTLLRSILLSLIYRNSADDCRFVLFDPKLMELGCFNGIPHLLCPVLSETEKMLAALDWVVAEIDERAQRMAKLSARSVELFNNRVRHAKKRGEMIARTVQTGFCERTGKPIYEYEQMEFEPMPHLVVAIDELSDLMSVAPQQCEAALLRIAEKGKAVGVHLVAATKTTNGLCLTDRVRAAMSSAIAFKLGSKVDSRIVLAEQGAEQLLHQGDALLSTGTGRTSRLHTPFVSLEEADAVCGVLRASGPSRYAPSLVARLQEAYEPFQEKLAAALADNRTAPPAAEGMHAKQAANRA